MRRRRTPHYGSPRPVHPAEPALTKVSLATGLHRGEHGDATRSRGDGPSISLPRALVAISVASSTLRSDTGTSCPLQRRTSATPWRGSSWGSASPGSSPSPPSPSASDCMACKDCGYQRCSACPPFSRAPRHTTSSISSDRFNEKTPSTPMTTPESSSVLDESRRKERSKKGPQSHQAAHPTEPHRSPQFCAQQQRSSQCAHN